MNRLYTQLCALLLVTAVAVNVPVYSMGNEIVIVEMTEVIVSEEFVPSQEEQVETEIILAPAVEMPAVWYKKRSTQIAAAVAVVAAYTVAVRMGKAPSPVALAKAFCSLFYTKKIKTVLPDATQVLPVIVEQIVQDVVPNVDPMKLVAQDSQNNASWLNFAKGVVKNVSNSVSKINVNDFGSAL